MAASPAIEGLTGGPELSSLLRKRISFARRRDLLRGRGHQLTDELGRKRLRLRGRARPRYLPERGQHVQSRLVWLHHHDEAPRGDAERTRLGGCHPVGRPKHSRNSLTREGRSNEAL